MSAKEKPPQETVDLYVEVSEKDLHFLEMVLEGYDGIAHLRRDWLLRDGRRFFKILVPPDFIEEVQHILESLRNFIQIGEIRRSF